MSRNSSYLSLCPEHRHIDMMRPSFPCVPKVAMWYTATEARWGLGSPQWIVTLSWKQHCHVDCIPQSSLELHCDSSCQSCVHTQNQSGACSLLSKWRAVSPAQQSFSAQSYNLRHYQFMWYPLLTRLLVSIEIIGQTAAKNMFPHCHNTEALLIHSSLIELLKVIFVLKQTMQTLLFTKKAIFKQFHLL